MSDLAPGSCGSDRLCVITFWRGNALVDTVDKQPQPETERNIVTDSYLLVEGGQIWP